MNSANFKMNLDFFKIKLTVFETMLAVFRANVFSLKTLEIISNDKYSSLLKI